MTVPDRRHMMRLSLVVVWLGTALISLIELHGQSTQLLKQAGVEDARMVQWLIWSGITADAVLGLALLLRPGRPVYLFALGTMLLMTLVATALHPALWLHPLGPLLKNLPIAAMLWTLAGDQS